MKNQRTNSTINKVLINDYEQFKGEQELIPSKNTTLIVDENGLDKTTLFWAIQEAMLLGCPGVIAEHSIEDATSFCNMIFVDEEHLLQPDLNLQISFCYDILNKRKQWKMACYFLRLLENIESYNNPVYHFFENFGVNWGTNMLLNSGDNIERIFNLSMGEKIIANCSLLLSLRAFIPVLLPLVIDFSFDHLIDKHKRNLINIIQNIPGQKIIFSNTSDYDFFYFNRLYKLKNERFQGNMINRRTVITPIPLLQLKQVISGVNISFIAYEFPFR